MLSSASANIGLRVTTDNFATVLSGASDYGRNTVGNSAGTAVAAQVSENNFALSAGTSVAGASEGLHGEVDISVASAGIQTIRAHVGHRDATVNRRVFAHEGHVPGAAARINGVRLFLSTGIFAGGTIRVLGMV
jgi:hypothetical protein